MNSDGFKTRSVAGPAGRSERPYIRTAIPAEKRTAARLLCSPLTCGWAKKLDWAEGGSEEQKH